MALNKGKIDVEVIRQILNDNTAKSIAETADVNLSLVQKLKNGSRQLKKLNLLDAIRLTEAGHKLKRKVPIVADDKVVNK